MLAHVYISEKQLVHWFHGTMHLYIFVLPIQFSHGFQLLLFLHDIHKKLFFLNSAANVTSYTI